DLGQQGVHGAGGRGVVEVDGHQRLGAVVQDALHVAFGSALEDAVDFFDRGVAAGHESQVHHGDVDGGHAHGIAVQLAVQLGQHQAHGRGGAGLGGDHAAGGGTGAAHVLVAHIGQHLVVGVGVDGGHQAADHAQFLVQGSDQGSQAVGRAGGVGDDGVRALEDVVVHAIDDGGVHVLAAGRGNDDLLGACLDVVIGFFLGGEGAGAFQHHVHVQFGPGQGQRIALAQQADGSEEHTSELQSRGYLV